jgi:hypothetical protein
MTQLTSDQLVKVKEKFCLNIVDNMDLDTLIERFHSITLSVLCQDLPQKYTRTET